jgi:hypothetical protein
MPETYLPLLPADNILRVCLRMMVSLRLTVLLQTLSRRDRSGDFDASGKGTERKGRAFPLLVTAKRLSLYLSSYEKKTGGGQALVRRPSLLLGGANETK